MTKAQKLMHGGLAAVFVAAFGCSLAMASERNVDPETMSPRVREFALHGPLGDLGPTGRPAGPGCRWSRLQIPTPEGLRWVAHEQCDPGFDHG